MVPDKNIRPKISLIEYVGRAGMGLPMNHKPVRVQLRILKDYEGAFIKVMNYVEANYGHLQRRFFTSY